MMIVEKSVINKQLKKVFHEKIKEIENLFLFIRNIYEKLGEIYEVRFKN